MRTSRRSPNYDERPAEGVIDMLVFHYTGMRSAGEALDRLCDAQAKVSAHYAVDEDGSIYSLVAEKHRAWHAGVAHWRGNADINARSIGIEIVNPGHEFGYWAFPGVQMAAVLELASDILQRHPIPARNVVGHSDVAPTRKQDPGELFDWPWLASQGVGLWPETEDAAAVEYDAAAASLERLGYDISNEAAAWIAFQRHFVRDGMTGEADDRSRARLAVLLDMAETAG